MKKVKIFSIGILLVSLFSFNFTSISAADVEIEITAPSDAESKIAVGRDFYVSGKIDNVQDLTNTTMEVVLKDSGGSIVRTIVGSKAGKQPMKIDFPNYYGNDRALLKDSGMPELIWDGTDDDSFYNGDIKCYYDENGFTALIIGGNNYDNGLGFKDKNGASYSNLTEGNYTIEVILKDNVGVVANTSKAIEIKDSSDKIMARFSPNEHLNRVSEFANDNNYRIYLDAFPGYFSKGDLFCEVLKEWRGADALEYATGKVHFIIYNVRNTSTTYAVELATLQRMGDVNNAQRLVNYYYEYGEPKLNNGVESDIARFDDKDKLALVRAEISEDASNDNEYDWDNVTSDGIEYDLDLSDGVDVETNDFLSIYGVSAPIQIDEDDILDKQDNSYQLNNKMTTLHYQIDGDGVNIQFDKEVELNRISGSWDNYSELEFKHTIEITEAMKGKQLTVSVSGYDKYGNKVDGSDEKFVVNVASDTAGVETNDNTNITLYFSLLVIAGTMITLKLKKVC